MQTGKLISYLKSCFFISLAIISVNATAGYYLAYTEPRPQQASLCVSVACDCSEVPISAYYWQSPEGPDLSSKSNDYNHAYLNGVEATYDDDFNFDGRTADDVAAELEIN